MITDHHTMTATRHGWNGWHDDVLVIVGYEHSDPHDANHLLVFGMNEPMDPTLSPRQYVHQATGAGGMVFLAHPVECRARRGKIRPYPWTASLDLPFQGVEVWNFMSLWAERYTARRALLNYVMPGIAGERPDDETLALWDRCAESRPVAGIAGLDAHVLKVPWGPLRLTLFPLARLFRGPLTMVETSAPLSRTDARADTAMLLAHLARGNSMMGVRKYGPLEEILTRFGSDHGQVWGETFVAREPVDLVMTLPRRACAKLLRSGRVVAETRGRTVRFPVTEPGIYRVELRRRGAVWVITNHLRVTRG